MGKRKLPSARAMVCEEDGNDVLCMLTFKTPSRWTTLVGVQRPSGRPSGRHGRGGLGVERAAGWLGIVRWHGEHGRIGDSCVVRRTEHGSIGMGQCDLVLSEHRGHSQNGER
jgi:hypothetical protein